MRRMIMLLMGLLTVLAVLTTACTDDDEEAVDHGAMLAALNTLELSKLHHVNGMLVGDAPMIDPAWLAPLRRARIATALTAWPEELQAAADDFLAMSMPLEMALADDDVEAASAVATEAHTAWHLLKDPAYQYLSVAAGIEGSEDEASQGDAHD